MHDFGYRDSATGGEELLDRAVEAHVHEFVRSEGHGVHACLGEGRLEEPTLCPPLLDVRNCDSLEGIGALDKGEEGGEIAVIERS